MTALDTLTVHQLIGRIVYFHALFIEPVSRDRPQSVAGEACCNHSDGPPTQGTVDELLEGSAWEVLREVAETLPAHHRPCPVQTGSCCATCHVASAGAAVGAGWAEIEHRAYGRTPSTEVLARACGYAVGARLGRAFAAQHASLCPRPDRIDGGFACPVGLPSPEELPLTGELLSLWADPTSISQRPVASWLNHCTSLDDVRGVLGRRTDP
ncbi:hypothetical protein [Streptodolium elevatio]|uniref:Uncharacterized protein n=1 Tax=Streptodolium elevatio TaxID=3157996 RepID=A0ABV3D8S9_9ACTN